MSKHYKIDKSQDFRRVRPEIVAASLLLFFTILGAVYVLFDLNKNEAVVDNSNNTAILGTVESTKEEYTAYERQYYQVKVPSNWKQVNNPEIILDGVRYYPERYQGVEGDNVGRSLDVYRQDIPAKLGINKVVSVTGVGHRIVPSETSPQCYKFTDYPEEQPGDNHPSSWEGVKFTCSTSEITNVLGAVESDQATGVKLDSVVGTTDFLLVYTDHGSRLDNSIFYEILDSFKAK